MPVNIPSVASVIIGLELGAFCVVAQTYISNVTQLPFDMFIALMLPVHLAIGLAEGIVTAAILCFIYKTRPEIIDSARSSGLNEVGSAKRVSLFLIVLAVLTILTGGLLSIFASTNPDGLEWAIGKTTEQTSGAAPEHTQGAVPEQEKGGVLHENAANAQDTTAVLPDYSFPSDPENAAGTSVSGIIGAVITFAFAGAAGLLITKMKKRKNSRSEALQ